MEEFILFLFIVGVFFLLIVIINKISALKSEIRFLNKRLSDFLMSQTASRIPPQQASPAMPEPPPVYNTEPAAKPAAVYTPTILPPVKPELSPAPELESAPALSPEPELVSASVSPAASAPELVPEFEQFRQESSPLSAPMYERASTHRPSISKKVDSNASEKAIGANWLSKIGIVTLVLGIGFFVKYAIDQEWINEIGRVGIGLFTGGLLIAIAHKLKAKYTVFSSILVGGGISVFYITITLAFREYELFSQGTAFIMLIVVTIFSVLLSLLYDRKELAIFSLLGGFAAPLMISTGTGNYIVLFSYILILNTGMLVVSFVKKWRVIGIMSYVLTLIFFWSWTLLSYKNQFLTVSLFVSLFFVQFYLLALFDHFKSEKKISVYQVLLILTNNLSAFVAFLYIIDSYSSDIRGLITIFFAVVNAVVMVALFRNSKIDRNLVYLIIAIVLSFVSLAIPIQLKGHVITMFWAAETVILLLLWQKSRIKVFYTGFILISFLTLFSYFMDINKLFLYSGAVALMSNRWFITGLVVLVSFVINMLLLKRESKETPLANIFKIIIILLAYIVPFLEINVQLTYHHTGNSGYSSFRYVALATFTTIYIAVLGIIYNKKVSSKTYIFGMLYAAVCLYAVCYTFLITNLRYEIFNYGVLYHQAWYFSIHLLSLPAIAYIIYLLVKNIKSYSENNTWLSWLLTILVVVILSVETDNIIVWMFANPYDYNYSGVLYDVRTFGYPILWGIIAMVLMIWGLNRKEALLRQISLVFFGLIIVKFYAYDVWKMSQAGRIVSFVLLGVILLLVSFLQQKIRTLVKSDDKPEIGDGKPGGMPETGDENSGPKLTDNVS